MESDDKDKPAATARRPSLWQFLLLAIIVVVVGGSLYYGAKLASGSAFNDERAFRILGNVAEQIGNLQTSRVNALKNRPERARPTSCVSPGVATAPRADQSKEMLKYLAKLDLVAPSLCSAQQSDDDFVSEVCDGPLASKGEFVFRMFRADQKLRVAVISCEVRDSLQESFESASDQFITQNFFDEAILALGDGTVLAEFPRQMRTSEVRRVELHPPTAQRLNIVNVAHLLLSSRAEQGQRLDVDSENDKPPAPDVNTGLPIAFDAEIGTRAYRIFVLPVVMPYAVVVAGQAQGGKTAGLERQEVLYLLGLHSQSMGGELRAALWPDGTWVITLVTVLIFLAWPLVSVAFDSPTDAISRRKVVACIVAVILAPAVLTIAATSLWGYAAVDAWYAENAARYAKRIEGLLHREIVDAARLLAADRDLYGWVLGRHGESAPHCSPLRNDPLEGFGTRVAGRSFVMRSEQGAALPAAPRIVLDAENKPSGKASGDEDQCAVIQLSAASGVANWSPLRNVIGINVNGERFGPSVTTFGDAPVKRDLKLADREYFQALQRGQAWVTRGTAGKQLHFVAQRLFNRSDASKALQIALPLCEPVTGNSNFCGVITGDIRVHSLIAPISPPQLHFAVIDNDTGTVLFHSDDRRSLSENFFRETGGNIALHAAIHSSLPRTFKGQYLGSSHAFHYRPIPDVPWGVVTFYSQKQINDLPMHAGAAALAAYAGYAFGLALLALGALWLWSALATRSSAMPRWITKCWPSARVPKWYRCWRWRPSIWAMLAILVIFLYGQPFWTALSLLVLIVIAGLGLLGEPPTDDASAEAKLTQRVNAHAEAITCLLIAVAVVPAIWLFMIFHDYQVAGLLRSGLVDVGTHLQTREELIQRDLQRWDSSPEADRAYAGVEQVIRLQESNYFGSLPAPRVDARESVDPPPLERYPWSRARPSVRPSAYESRVWRMTAGSVLQLRRLRLLNLNTQPDASPAARDEVACWSDGTAKGAAPIERCTIRKSEGGDYEVGASTAQMKVLSAPGTDENLGGTAVVCLALIAVFAASIGQVRFLLRRVVGLSASYQLPIVGGPAPVPRQPPKNEDEFAERWTALPPSDQLLLYEVAQRELPNPAHDNATQRMIQQGWIKLDPWPTLASDELRRWIRAEAKPAQFEPRRREAGRSPWRQIRTPLFVLLMIVIAWFNWAAGGSMKALLAMMLAAAAFLDQLKGIFGVERGAGSSK